MANGLPNNLYSGGAVVFDSRPSVNLYAQFLARKQAREEALDQYEANRINRINETGLRDIDREGLDARVLGLRQFYNANKDKIRKGNTPEAYNYEKMFRDTLSGVNESKNATALGETTYKFIGERRKLGRNTPDEMFNEYTQMENTPVWDEKYKRFDIMKWNAQTDAKHDLKKYLDLFKGIKRTPQPPRYEEIPGDKFSRNQYIDEAFDDNAKSQIRTIAENEFDMQDGLVAQVQTAISDPMKRGQLEKIFLEEFGTSPQSLKDYNTAITLQMLQTKLPGKPKQIPLWEERQKLLQGYKQQNIATYNWYKQQDRANQDYFIDAIIEDQLQTSSNNDGYFSPSPLVKMKFAVPNVFGDKVAPAKFRFIDNGTSVEYYNSKGEVINKIGINEYKANVRDEFTARGTASQIQQSKVTQKPVSKDKRPPLNSFNKNK